MRTWLHSWLLGGLLFCAAGASLDAQAPPPQPAPEKAEPVKAAEKYERDNSTTVIPYSLAAIAVIIVMVLVCMPARRE